MKPTAIIVDIDGTLAHMNDRSPYDPTKYHADTVDEVIKEITSRYFDDGFKVVVCSGRDATYRDITDEWLTKHGVKHHELFMRVGGDKRSDDIVKSEIYHDKIKPLYDVYFVLDDRDRVVKMWRENGLKCLQVADGNF